MTAALEGAAPPAGPPPQPAPDAPAAPSRPPAPTAAHAPAAAHASGPWERVVASAPTPRLKALLAQVDLASLDDRLAVLAPAPEVRRLLEQRLAEVEQHVAAALGRPVRCTLEEPGQPAPPPAAPDAEGGESPVNVVMSHPLVRRAIEVFNARVVRVERAERTVRSDGD